ncbi:hypothetical protein PAXRUDRAFT_825790 [Paxillus rubicundulus Ve08.2h10]|uniref:Uncharacterized protein n=1 Tax=Paxillus rubicundulus Ve08.2h10 TaxID=930991 RepID=A0A0D0EAG9_9AGAM|nr:hypothetical protein PAXRUDRAFT_825790 [Paxillus rubicundulus Ve08.2h10]
MSNRCRFYNSAYNSAHSASAGECRVGKSMLHKVCVLGHWNLTLPTSFCAVCAERANVGQSPMSSVNIDEAQQPIDGILLNGMVVVIWTNTSLLFRKLSPPWPDAVLWHGSPLLGYLRCPRLASSKTLQSQGYSRPSVSLP